jgi:quercetin dioxygenase-like cupin family protein
MCRSISVFITAHRSVLMCIATLCVSSAVVHADSRNSNSQPPTAVRDLFSTELADAPGKRLVVVGLEFGTQPRQSTPHRHPGSVYIYVTKGTMRLGIEGQPVQVVHAGESFFEPVGAVHTVAENASTSEPASAIAVHIVPDGAPLVTLDHGKGCQQ